MMIATYVFMGLSAAGAAVLFLGPTRQRGHRGFPVGLLVLVVLIWLVTLGLISQVG